MSNDAPPPPADGFPQGRPSDMQDLLLSQPTGGKPPSSPSRPWEPPTAEELQKLLPQYEITSLLGRGGMGAVYRGRQIALDRPVAIKILSNSLEEADANFAERFKNEARAMAKLSHPGIVGVYDFGETAGGLLYIVMEFIEGTDVSKMLAQEKRLHTEHAMAITAHVCDALAYAHERGIIHRDIKPANIMVGYDGVVKVADFGLAKMNSTASQTGLTQSGMAMGTLHYMAPESLMLGTAVDHRADIYAVGVMLYQMLTGKLPQGLFELPSLQVPGLDPRYDGIIGKSLREDRDLRYSSVVAMRQDLDAILTQPVVKVEAAAGAKAPAALNTQARPKRPGGQPHRPPPSPKVIVRTEKKGSPLLWVALVAMSGIAGWLYWQSSNQLPVTVGDVPASPQMAKKSGVASNTPELPEKSAPPQMTPVSQAPSQAPATPSVSVRHTHKVTSNQFELRWNNDAISEETVRSILANWDVGAVGMQELMGVAPQRRGPVFVVVEASTESLPRVGFTSYLPKVGNDIGLSSPLLNEVVALHQEQTIVWSTLFHVITDAYTSKADAKWVRISRTPTGEAIMYGLHTVVRHAAWKTDMLDRVASPMGNGGPLQTLAAERATIDAHLAAYEVDNHSSWASEMNKGTGTSYSPGSVHLLAGILFRLAAENGGAPFLQRLLAKEISDMPEIVSEHQALEELAKACSRAAGRDLKTDFIRRWRWPLAESSTPTLPTGPTTWTDTKGRTITATFKAIANGNVLLDIAGKVTPVPLNTLSVESQKLAQDFQALLPISSPSTGSMDWLMGRWTRVLNDKPGQVDLHDFLPDHTVLLTGEKVHALGVWNFDSGLLVLKWPAGTNYIRLTGTEARTELDGYFYSADKKSTFYFHMKKLGGLEAGLNPLASDLVGRKFAFWKSENKPAYEGGLTLMADGRIQGEKNLLETNWRLQANVLAFTDVSGKELARFTTLQKLGGAWFLDGLSSLRPGVRRILEELSSPANRN